MTSSEAGARANATLVVPVGSTEQHGPHLPLSTDTDIALAMARRLARDSDNVVVAPEIAYGSSGEHQDFPGTLSIGQEALELLLVELGRSASRTFARMLLVSAHGGNAGPVTRAARRLCAEGRDVSVWMPRWQGDAHAGYTETSLQLALDPSRVRMELAEAGNTLPIRDLMAVISSSGIAAVSPNGILGDPAGAGAAAGERLLALLTDDLIRHYDEWTSV